MPEITETIDALGRAFEEFKSANDSNLKKRDVVLDEKLDRLNVALDAAQAAKDAFEAKQAALALRQDEVEKKLNRPGFGHNSGASEAEQKALASFNTSIKSFAGLYSRPQPAEATAEDLTVYVKGFGKFVRGGERAFDDTERKAMSVGSDPDGGYLVTPDVSGRIVTRVFETTPMRQIASVQVISTDALEGIEDKDEAASGGWVAEAGTRGTTNTPQLAKWRIPVHEMFAQPYATQQLLDDAAVDVEAWLAGKVADKLSRVQNDAYLNGTGVGQPRGLTTYTTAATADATRAWGSFEHVATGVSSDFAASTPADILFDLIQAFKDAYLNGARWMTRREVIGKIRKFKESTTNAYMWQPGLQQGQPQVILGYPVTVSQDMPALASGSLSLAFGDFAQGYQIVDRQGFRTLRDPYTNKPFVQFYTTARTGGGALQFECVKFIKFGS
jgi:HK97 family phage major capsid protein